MGSSHQSYPQQNAAWARNASKTTGWVWRVELLWEKSPRRSELSRTLWCYFLSPTTGLSVTGSEGTCWGHILAIDDPLIREQQWRAGRASGLKRNITKLGKTVHADVLWTRARDTSTAQPGISVQMRLPPRVGLGGSWRSPQSPSRPGTWAPGLAGLAMAPHVLYSTATAQDVPPTPRAHFQPFKVTWSPVTAQMFLSNYYLRNLSRMIRHSYNTF